MLTIKQHLESIEDEDVREKALRNVIPYMQDKEVRQLSHAIILGIDSGNTTEGFAYWQNIYNQLKEKGL